MRFRIAGVALLVVIVAVLGYWLLAPTPQPSPGATEPSAMPTDIKASVLKRARDYDPSAQLRLVSASVTSNDHTYTFVGEKGFSITAVGNTAPLYLTDLPEDTARRYAQYKPLIHWSIDAPTAIARAESIEESIRGKVESVLLQHAPESQFHGGAEPPISLTTPPNPYWVISARTNFPITGRVVYIDAITGEKLFATDFALK